MDWTPRRTSVDETVFDTGRIGPYRLGRRIRSTTVGDLTMAIGDPFEEVVALERCHLLGSIGGVDGVFLSHVAHVVGLRHRHLVPVIGAGVEADIPYVIRAHHLGATLADALEAAGTIDLDTGAAILHAVLEAVAFLAEEGASPGVCALGGFDDEDVMLGYDGTVLLTNTGLKLVRCPSGDPIQADLSSALVLATKLDPTGELAALFALGADASDVAILTRRSHRDACGRRSELVGGLLRRHFESQIQSDRSFFGLTTLH